MDAADQHPADSVRRDVRAMLTAAMKARDRHTVDALRAFLGALDNAEAADLSDAPTAQLGIIAGGVVGLGAGEVPRRTLTSADIEDVLQCEVDVRRAWPASAGGAAEIAVLERLRDTYTSAAGE